MKNLPTGIDDFKLLRTADYYYVDKTMLLKKFQPGKVLLYTRPRRFGKTLNMSMIKNFYEIGSDPILFEGLKITKDKEFCKEQQGKYPVISISLKRVDGNTFEEAVGKLSDVIGEEAERFTFLLSSQKLSEDDKEDYRKLLKRKPDSLTYYTMPINILTGSLQKLSFLLSKHYGTGSVIIIDEYDVPLDKAHVHGYYNEMVGIIRSMFHDALKSNSNMAFAVLTGCLRVSKESIFTGMNNLKPESISMLGDGDLFGFNEAEVDAMLKYYGISDRKSEVKEWYDGYRFGKSEIYCPWDVINYVEDITDGNIDSAISYWANSSGNDLVREFVELASESTTEDLEKLVSGKSVNKRINENLTYRDLEGSIDNLWSILYSTGYLTGKKGEDNIYTLWIPNNEVRQIYEEDILKWFDERVRSDTESATRFYQACLNGNSSEMNKVLNKLLRKSISVRDTFTRKDMKENFYHGFILGLLSQFGDIQSNREGGNGFSDITIVNDKMNKAAILELKYSENQDLQAMESACDEALKQIEDKNYAEDLILSGYDVINKYGISFNKKRSFVKMADGEQEVI